MRDLHHIDHDPLFMTAGALKGASDGRVRRGGHHGDEVGAGAECDISFGFARVHDLQVRRQRQLRKCFANAAQGAHALAKDKRRANLSDVDMRMRIG